MQKIKINLLITFFLFLFIACQKNETKNNEASIIKMSFDFGEVTFDGDEGYVKAPDEIDLEKLIPTIEVSEGAVVYPPSNAITDFTEPVDYTVTSEDQENIHYYTISVFSPIVKFTVFDCTNRSQENPVAELALGAKISIFKDVSGEEELVDEIATDENGEALFYGYREINYHYSAEKNGATDLIGGYKINGIFESQEDIDNYAEQNQPSQVGDLKFLDLNGDSRVNEDDIINYAGIGSIPESGVKEVTIYIATE